jgi:hypothetical protein
MGRNRIIETTVVADDGSQATVSRVISDNHLVMLWERGTITEEQYDAAIEIARIYEEIGRPVGLRCASLEARIDNSGSARDILVEHVARVRLEATYNRWRIYIPAPKRMIIDMAIGAISLTTAARRYRMRKVKARIRLVDALNLWIEFRDRAQKEIDERDVELAQNRAGGGILA